MRFREKDGTRAKGMLWCSQVAPGHENGLMVRVYGTKGGLEWTQKDPNYLWYTPFGEPKRLLTRAGAGASPAAARVSRIPSGHPEGYLEGFANIYSEAAGRSTPSATAGRGSFCHLSDDRRWHEGHDLRRCLRAFLGAQRRLDQGLNLASRSISAIR